MDWFDMKALNGLGIRTSIVPLCGLGFRLFPLYAGQKLPSIKGWVTDASNNSARVLEWFNEERNRDGNLGLATGEGSGIVVLDADDEEARQWCSDLFHGHPEHVRTSRGGHFYVKYPTGVDARNSAGKLYKGVDVRANGGLVVVPPSVSKGKRYEWNECGWDFPLECPPELREWLGPQKAVRVPVPPRLDMPRYASVPRKIQRIIDRQIANVRYVGEGSRNKALFDAAFLLGSIERSGVCRTSLHGTLRFIEAASPLPKAEIEKAVDSGWKIGLSNGTFHWSVEDEREELLHQLEEGI